MTSREHSLKSFPGFLDRFNFTLEFIAKQIDGNSSHIVEQLW